MKQIKKSFLTKKASLKINRAVQLKKPEEIKKILLVTTKEDKATKRIVEKIFENAGVHIVYTRSIKADTTVGFYYSVHTSDFNLTGHLKNDKLINLDKMSFDLLIDLSVNSKLLDFFVKRSTAGLKIGNINTSKVNNYDFFVDFGSNNEDCIKNIFNQLNTLTQNEQV